MRKRVLTAFLALCLLILTACSQIGTLVSEVTNPGEFPVEIEGVTIAARPSRVAVLSASLADVVLALGRETQLAAVPADCGQKALSTLQKVDPANTQAVVDLAPDLVLLDASQSGLAGPLTEAGLTVLPLAPAVDREDFERLYAQVSSALAGGGAGYDDGITVAQDVFTTLDDINRIVPKEKVVTACYLYDTESAAVTGDMLASTVMNYAGVTNIFRSLSGGVYDFDSLRVSNPDVIFCAPGVQETLLSDSRFANFVAVKNHRVFELDPSLVQWQGRTVVTLAYEISAAAFPELLEEQDPQDVDPIDEINSQVTAELSPSPSPSTVPSPSPAPAGDYTPLQLEDENDDVFRMQQRLEELGYLEGDYTGYFGEYTQTCVMIFQQLNGLEETGVADAETLTRLYSDQAIPATGAEGADTADTAGE